MNDKNNKVEVERKSVIAVFFPKDSEALFNCNSKRTFGGASVQLYNIVKELSNYKNIKVYSVIPKYKSIKFPDFEKFNLVQLYNETDNAFIKFIKTIIFIKKYSPTVIIQRGLTTESCFLAFLCKLLNIKFVFMFAHDVEVHGLRQRNQKKVPFIKMLLTFADVLITQNQYQKDNLLVNYGAKSVVIYNGYEISKSHKKKSVVKNKNILWVARCDEWKQPELFIELAKRNSNMYFLMICPKSSNQNYYEIIKGMAECLPNCKFISFVSYFEIDKYFQDAYIFINTSKCEGFPQTFIQSIINCVPILSLNVNPEDFLTRYNCGVYCNGDFELLDKNFKRLLIDKRYYQMIKNSTFEYAKKFHNIKLNVKQLLILLNLI